jgi:hypothetical protein
VDTRILNNILINNEAFGISIGYASGHTANTIVDDNLYQNNGWRTYDDGGIWHAGVMVVSEGGSWDPYQTLAEAQAATPWEDHGLEGDTAFWDYDLDDHSLYDGSYADFHLMAASEAIDQGTDLPASLVSLLEDFGINDPAPRGAAFDLGRYEAGFAFLADPDSRSIQPGGTAQYSLSLDPADLPHPVTLELGAYSSDLIVTLSADTLQPGGTVTLTVTHTGTGVDRWYIIPVNGSGGGFTGQVSVRLLVGGLRLYLPVVLFNAGLE